MAASMLSFEPIVALGPDRHLALLRWLTDALLETQKVRSAIQSEWAWLFGAWAPRGLPGRAIVTVAVFIAFLKKASSSPQV